MPQEPQRPSLVPLTDDSFAALIRLFMSPANPKWVLQEPKGYSEATKESWTWGLRFASRPDTLGALKLTEIRPSLVQAFFDGIAHLPGKQHVILTALRQIEKWAIVRDLLPRQITLGVEITASDGGHIPWTAEQVRLAADHVGRNLRRVILLGAYTGQRVSDTIRMAPTDIENVNGIAGINVRQKKTGRAVWVPIISQLADEMRTWEVRPGPFLLRPDGRPWVREALSDAWRDERIENAALEPVRDLVLHGLRAHACVQLRRAGAEGVQIADMIGMSVQMVERYCRFSVQRENATAAVINLERTIRERNAALSTKNTA